MHDKNSDLATLNQQLQEEDALIQERNLQLTAEAQQLEEKERQLQENNQQLQDKDALIYQANLELIDLNQQLQARDSLVHERNLQFIFHEQELHERDRQIHEKNLQLAALRRQLQEQEEGHRREGEQLIRQHAQQHQEKEEGHRREIEQLIRQHAQQHQEKEEGHRQEIEQLIQQHAQQLHEKDQLIGEQAAQLLGAERGLHEKERQLQEQDKELQEKEQRLRHSAQQLTEAVRQQHANKEIVAARDLAIQEREQQIEAINQQLKTETKRREGLTRQLQLRERHLESKTRQVQDKTLEVQEKERLLQEYVKAVEDFGQSGSYRLGRMLSWPLRAVKQQIGMIPNVAATNGLEPRPRQPQPAETISAAQSPVPEVRPIAEVAYDYGHWVELYDILTDADREAILARVDKLAYKPRISIIMPVYNVAEVWLRKAIDSVIEQLYPDWELCIADDNSTQSHVRRVLEEYAATEGRIKVAFSKNNHGIAITSNRALKLATGEFIGLLDHDDELTPDALYEVVSSLQTVDADLIYSDEDKRDLEGRRCEPFFKPAWSPDLLLSYMYLCHFSVYRKSIVDRLGGFREGFDGSQDYDLALRFTETTNKIAHIPKILYHWRMVPASTAATVTAKPQAFVAAQKALADALHRRNIAGEVETNTEYGYYRIKREIVSPGKVTIIIPTRDQLSLLRRCIDSIESSTDYKNYEIVIVDNGSEELETLQYFEHTPHTVIRDEGEFNFSRLNNLAARQSNGEYLLLLNNDTEVIADEWLSAMVEHAQRPEVGAVGAKLLYPDGRIQHAGVVIGLGGLAGHSHKFVDGFSGTGYAHFPNLIRNYSAVTAACLMMRREVFNEMGGLNEQDLAVSFNDVDLCLRLRKRGYLIVYTPHALLYHHESASRGYDLNQKEISYMKATWHQELMSDPYYNPNLSLHSEDFAIDYSKPERLYCVFAHLQPDGVVEDLHRQRNVGQEFFTSENKLSGIAVRFGTHSTQVKGTVKLHLRESYKAERDIVVVAADASLIVDNEYYLFLFEPIKDSGGKRYYFYVEFIEASPSETLTIWKRTITSKEAGPYFENHQPVQGTLLFKVFCDKRFFRYNSSSDLLCLIVDRT